MRKKGSWTLGGMEPGVTGYTLDPAKCSEMSLEEKRQLVYEISQWPESAPDLLQSWSRRDLLQLICAEMGKERKYTGITKTKMIEHLLRLVSEKKAGRGTADQLSTTPTVPDSNPSSSKRQRKKDDPLRLPVDSSHVTVSNNEPENRNVILCQNLVCRATMKPGDAFCKRCSCSICYRYDDNKDPSLWLVCGSDSPNQDDSCGMSYHLECAFKHEKAGISKNGRYPRLDGSFYCVSCGKVNGLLGCWRKQLSIAKDARRVDILCYRISICQRILRGTERYKGLNEIVNVAAKKLKEEVGPLRQVSLKMARGIVNRLSCGAEVQKLCSFAIEAVDSMLQAGPEQLSTEPSLSTKTTPSFSVHFEDVSSTTVMVILQLEDKKSSDDITGCRLWHRSVSVIEYPEEPMYIFLEKETKFMVSGLDPSTEYVFKVVPFTGSRELGESEARWKTGEMPMGDNNTSTSQSAERVDKVDSGSTLEEENVTGEHASVIQAESQRDSTNSSDDNQAPKRPKTLHENHSKVRPLDEISNNNECDMLMAMEIVPLTCSNSAPPDTPCKPDMVKELPKSEKQDTEGQYEHCVKVIRWLECEGHVDKEFRVKFLTWFSLKATMQERRVVSVFVDTLIDDPASLAGQLIDAFLDRICSKKLPPIRNVFCTRLWH
ncbi:unnamed protein product [Victoria cruziana]